MSTATQGPALAGDRLHEYCDFMLGTLSRADQRRWGEVYVRGLLRCEGRRSIKQIVTTVGGCSEQSLQQFVNQSPWNPQPVRQRLAAVLAASIRPSAWVLDEVAFDKHGAQSAAVERQFVPSQGRVRNCQLGAVAMLASADRNAAVDWRLAVPRSWDGDTARRKNAHVPDDQRHQPFWRYQLEMLDNLSGDWGIPLAPVLLDARHCPVPEQLVVELESRGLDYLVQLGAELTPRHRLVPEQRRGQVDRRPPVSRVTVVWRSPGRTHSLRSQFALAPAHLVAAAGVPGAARSLPQRRSVLTEWRLGGTAPRGHWLTNMTDRPVTELAALVKLGPSARHDLDELTRSAGLGHHEGRSFGGWHHHVTLVSVAQGFQVLDAVREPGTPAVPDAVRRAQFCW